MLWPKRATRSEAMAHVGILLCLLLAVHLHGVACDGKGKGKRCAQALYVFGDSYADTGNHDPDSADPDIAKPWRFPYGSTWPGEPSGRYSDGHLFTDFYVSQIRAKYPVPFRTLNISETKSLGSIEARSRGINFAFGASGVFTTGNPLVLNVSMQIDQLRATIDLGIVTAHDISKSKALFVISGNDYIYYIQQHPNFTGIIDYIPLVVEQMGNDLKILAEIGFKSFVVNNLAPLGCTPYVTQVNNYSACVDDLNTLCAYHNTLLAAQISYLQQTLTDTTFVTNDLFSAFEQVIEESTLSLSPCCNGDCGIMDANGTAQYTLCSDPEETLYWDSVHPTNFGWKKIFSYLFSSIQTT